MITIINEKKDQADDFADALGGRTGTLPADSTLPNEQYQIFEAAGHLTEFAPLKEMVPEDSVNEFTSWDYNNLPFNWHKINFRKVIKPQGSGKGAKYYMDNFKRALANSDGVVIATDNDPSGEGDMIGWEIIDYCHYTGKVYRLKHFEEVGVKEAFKNLVEVTPDDGTLKRAEAREKFDYLTIQYVRIITDEAAKHQVLPAKAVVRTGRLKGALIDQIGRAEVAHDSFTPSSVYEPALFDGKAKFLRKDMQTFKTKEEAKNHLDMLPPDAKVAEVNKQKVASKPPKMLDLSTVSARLEKKGFNSNEVNKLAETMYQAHYLSYPRTEDDIISPDHLKKLIPNVPKIAKVVGVDMSDLDLKNFRKYLVGTKNSSGQAVSHGANRPGDLVPDDMSELEDLYGKTGVALYNELARSFLAGFAKDKISERHIYADDKTGQYKHSVTVMIDPGWSKIINEDIDEDADKESDKLLTVGDPLTKDVYEKKATRPSLMNWSRLNKILIKNKIGTGATRLTTYNDIKDPSNKSRQLVINKSGKLTLTKLGTISFLLMLDTTLASAVMTSRLEEYLKKVQAGSIKEQQFLNFFDKLIAHDKPVMLKNQIKLKTLPKVKTNHHNKIKMLFEPAGVEKSFNDGFGSHKFTEDELKELCAGHEITIEIDGKKGKMKIKGKLSEDPKYGFGFHGQPVWDKKPQYTGILKATGKEFSFNKQFGQHTFTQEEADKLLAGEVVEYPAKSKKKPYKPYTARVQIVYSQGYKMDKKIWHVAMVFDDKKKSRKKKA